MFGPFSQQKSAKRLTGVAANAKLISRQWFRSGATFSVPAGAGWIIARAVGPGGASDVNGYPGGGGAFARRDSACSPGQSVVVAVAVGATGATRAATTVSLAGSVVCQAAAGGAATSSAPGQGGTVELSFGNVLAAGGSGAALTNGSVAGNGTNGGSGGSGTSAAGGGSGGESNAPDALILGGRGADANGGPGYGGRGGFPGGGASIAINGGNPVAAPGGDGVAVVEFWSAKP